MASLNLAGKTSGYVKLQAPDDSSNNPVVTLPTESGELALKGTGGLWTEEGGKAVYDGDIEVNGVTVGGNGSNTVVGKEARQGTGTQITAMGYQALNINNGDFNTAVGAYSLKSAVDITHSTAVGVGALQNLTSGSFNTAIGVDAGKTLTTGSNNIIIGQDAQPSSPTVSNEITIGDSNIEKTRLVTDEVGLYGSSSGSSQMDLDATGITYRGIGGINRIAFKWDKDNRKIIGVVDNALDVPLVLDDELKSVETAIDKKLAIKDKLIEKLSERLDALEKKLKK